MRVSMCHCLACQKRTGSTFGAQARWPRDKVAIEGHSTEYVRIGDSGNSAHVPLLPALRLDGLLRAQRHPDVVAVAIGAFADPSFPPPKFSVYELRMHAWTGVPEDAEHIDWERVAYRRRVWPSPFDGLG